MDGYSETGIEREVGGALRWRIPGVRQDKVRGVSFNCHGRQNMN